MLNFHVVTLFPDLISTYVETSIIGRGIKAERLTVRTYNPRDFATDSYRKVDDTPYGGGAGMVLKPEPFFTAFESIERSASSPVLLMSPQGERFAHNSAATLAETEVDITILCGHYEGFDERIRTLATHEYSMGDYVLTGGELAALIVIDAVGRLVPGVVGKHLSVQTESFVDGLLEGPQYTKPVEFRGMTVPEVVRSGNHKLIATWRRQEALRRTLERRPDLLEAAELDKADRRFLESIKETSE
jgi:tRNA (guanine37-N1)-methyltransferase